MTEKRETWLTWKLSNSHLALTTQKCRMPGRTEVTEWSPQHNREALRWDGKIQQPWTNQQECFGVVEEALIMLNFSQKAAKISCILQQVEPVKWQQSTYLTRCWGHVILISHKCSLVKNYWESCNITDDAYWFSRLQYCASFNTWYVNGAIQLWKRPPANCQRRQKHKAHHSTTVGQSHVTSTQEKQTLSLHRGHCTNRDNHVMWYVRYDSSQVGEPRIFPQIPPIWPHSLPLTVAYLTSCALTH